MFRRSIPVTLFAVTLAFAAQPASAAEYVYGSWNGPKNVVLTEGVAPYLKAVTEETGGSLKWKLLAGAQLFGGRATLAGIRDRVLAATSLKADGDAHPYG